MFLFDALVVLLRAASNVFAPSFFGACLMATASIWRDGPFTQAFASTFVSITTWSFTTTEGVVVSSILAALGAVHGVRSALAGTHRSALGVVGLIVDNSWAAPNQVLGSVWATVTLYMPIAKAESHGSARLVLERGVIPGYATTIGNVTAGKAVPRHEFQHVLQSWIFGPFFYPVFVVNYVFNTLVPLWWAIKAIFGIWPGNRIDSFGAYFTRGVYPFTLFEAWAYAVEGHP